MKIKFILFLWVLILPYPALGDDVDRNYLLLERSKKTDSGLRVSTLGAFGFSNNMFAHLNLSYIESRKNGGGTVFDIGLGYSYKMVATFFAGGGYMLGYNTNKSDIISAYYPEVGIAAEISRNFGIIISSKRLFNIYNQNENIILFGLLFSDQ